MQYRFACNHCQRLLKATPEMAGKSVRCPACKQQITIPRPDVQQADVQQVVERPADIPQPAIESAPKGVPQISVSDGSHKTRARRRPRKAKQPVLLWGAGAVAIVGIAIAALVLIRRSPKATANPPAKADTVSSVIPQSPNLTTGGSTDANRDPGGRRAVNEPAAGGSDSQIDPEVVREAELAIKQAIKRAEAGGAIVDVQAIPGGTVTTIDLPYTLEHNEETANVDETAKSPAGWLADLRDASATPLERGKAYMALRKLGARALPVVQHALDHPENVREKNYLRDILARILVQMTVDGVPQAKTNLQQLMEGDDREDVKRLAVSGMLIEGASKFVDWMGPYIDDESESMREKAFDIILRSGPPATLRHVAGIARFTADPNASIRRRAFDALREAGPDAVVPAIPVLLSFVDHPDPKVQEDVLYLIFLLKPWQYPELKQMMLDELQPKFAATDPSDLERHGALKAIIGELKR